MIQIRDERCDDFYRMTLEKCLSFYIMFSHKSHSLCQYFPSFGRRSTWQGRRQDICMEETRTHMEERERAQKSPTDRDKMRSLHLKGGLLLSNGCGLGVRSPMQTRKLWKLYNGPVPTTNSSTTNLFTTYSQKMTNSLQSKDKIIYNYMDNFDHICRPILILFTAIVEKWF